MRGAISIAVWLIASVSYAEEPSFNCQENQGKIANVKCKDGKVLSDQLKLCDPTIKIDENNELRDTTWDCKKKMILVGKTTKFIGIHTSFCLVGKPSEADIKRSTYNCGGEPIS